MADYHVKDSRFFLHVWASDVFLVLVSKSSTSCTFGEKILKFCEYVTNIIITKLKDKEDNCHLQ